MDERPVSKVRCGEGKDNHWIPPTESEPVVVPIPLIGSSDG